MKEDASEKLKKAKEERGRLEGEIVRLAEEETKTNDAL